MTKAEALSNALAQLRGLRANHPLDYPWIPAVESWIERLAEDSPSGSGIDGGSRFLVDESTPQKLRFSSDYHHMNDAGMYDGWTDHVATCVPTFQGPEVFVSGRNRNDIKEYLAYLWSEWFQAEIPEMLECADPPSILAAAQE
jgi:hypothetical protein